MTDASSCDVIRRLQRNCAIAVVVSVISMGCAFLALIAPNREAGHLQASSLTVTGKAGGSLVLRDTETGPQIHINDKNGTKRISIGLQAIGDWPEVAVCNAKGHVVGAMNARLMPDGVASSSIRLVGQGSSIDLITHDGAKMLLEDQIGQSVRLDMYPGKTKVGFFVNEIERRLGLSYGESGWRLVMQDSEGNRISSIP